MIKEFLPYTFLQISALVHIFMVIWLYFTKKKVKTVENYAFGIIIFSMAFAIILDICSILLTNVIKSDIFGIVINKLFLVTLFTWMTSYTFYVFSMTSKRNQGFVSIKENKEIKFFKKAAMVYVSIYFVVSMLMIFLPLSPIKDNNYMLVEGPAVWTMYLMFLLYGISWIVIIIVNFDKNNIKKYNAVWLLLVVMIFSVVMQILNDNLLFTTAAAAFATVYMYFTIENPDIWLIGELKKTRDIANAANAAKTDFLSNMSHEIRTPLNAIVGFGQALAEEDISETAKEAVNDIIMSSSNLLEIVNGILDISKVESNKIEIVDSEYSFPKLVKDVSSLARIRLQTTGKPIELQVKIDPNIPPVLFGDPLRVREIMINFLTNAVKYTNEGYIIFSVDGLTKGGICRLIISVEDTGIGIKQENIDKLFNKFQRLDLEQNQAVEGTGLGLAITKRVIETMGGKIVVRSEYGKGSKFIVSLNQKVVDKTLDEIEIEDEEDGTPFDASGQKVLVVDEDKVSLRVAKRLLRDYKVSIDTLEDGYTCIENIKKGKKYDLILMDDILPQIKGVDVLNELKKIEGFNTPVVVFTANAITGIKEKYLSEGFTDYLAKPIIKSELRSLLSRYLKERDDNMDNGGLAPQVDNDLVVTGGSSIVSDFDTMVSSSSVSSDSMVSAPAMSPVAPVAQEVAPVMPAEPVAPVAQEVAPVMPAEPVAPVAQEVAPVMPAEPVAPVAQEVAPVMPAEPVAPVAQEVAPVMPAEPVAPVAQEVAPVMPAEPVAPVAQEVAPVMPAEPVAPVAQEAAPAMPAEPVAPVAQEVAPAMTAEPVAPVAQEVAPVMPAEPVAPVAQEVAPVMPAEPVAPVAQEVAPVMPAEPVAPVTQEAAPIAAPEPVEFDGDKHSADYLTANGVDVNQALEFLGDMDTYDIAAEEFYAEFDNQMGKIQSFKDSGDMANYVVETHGLKSNARYLGFMKLGDIAFEHEEAGKVSNVDYINANYDLLVAESTFAYKVIKNYLGQ